MPYIEATEREKFDVEIDSLARSITSAGHLAYVVYRLAGMVVKNWGGGFVPRAEVNGAVIEAMAEYRRRETVPYEAKKCEENGDVPF